MIRNLKILLAAAMALSALGAIGASGAQAANEFHCSVEPCIVTMKPDGAVPNKTSHHVWIFTQLSTSVSMTCNQLTGQATSNVKTAKTLTFTNLQYHTCNIAGSASTVNMNGCTYLFTASGLNTASMTVTCPVGKKIEIVEPVTGCVISIGSQPAVAGIKTHDPQTGGIPKTELTTEIAATFEKEVTANNKCGGFGIAEGALIGHYTTGNVELAAETHSGVHASLWFA